MLLIITRDTTCVLVSGGG